MVRIPGWPVFALIAFLLVSCNAAPSTLTGVVSRLEDVKTYGIEYRLTTFFDGVAKPIEASGLAEFEGPDRFRIRQESLEMIGNGFTVYVNVSGTWLTEETVELPMDPLLYLKAATNVKQTDNGKDGETISFTIDRKRYRQAIERTQGTLPPSLGRILTRFSGTGEITLDSDGKPASMKMHLKESAVGPGKNRQEEEILFVAFGKDYHIETPLESGATQPRAGGQ